MGRNRREWLLIQVCLGVPFTPDPGRSEHSTTMAHCGHTIRRASFSIPSAFHLLYPKAAWPEREVLPLETRGICATALPVPYDSAEAW